MIDIKEPNLKQIVHVLVAWRAAPKIDWEYWHTWLAQFVVELVKSRKGLNSVIEDYENKISNLNDVFPDEENEQDVLQDLKINSEDYAFICNRLLNMQNRGLIK